MHLNPYNYKAPIEDPTLIVGRDDFAREVALKLKGKAHIALFGPRKTGKTTFTVKLRNELSKPHGLAAPPVLSYCIDLSDVLSIADFIIAIYQGVLDDPIISTKTKSSLRGQLEKVEEELQIDLRVVKFRSQVQGGRLLDEYRGVLGAVLHVLAQSAKRVVVIFDEFQNLEKVPGEPLAIVRKHLGGVGAGHVNLFLTGSIRRKMQLMLHEDTAQLWESVEEINLPRIARADFREYLAKSADITDKPFEEEALEYLLTVSRSHPLTVQKLAYKAWEVTSSYSPITLETVQAAFRASLDELAEKYSDECAGMRAADEEELLKLLYSLAERGWPGITGEERLVLYGFKESKAIYRARDTLMGRGILEHPGKGQYIISNPIFEAWLKQRNAQNAD